MVCSSPLTCPLEIARRHLADHLVLTSGTLYQLLSEVSSQQVEDPRVWRADIRSLQTVCHLRLRGETKAHRSRTRNLFLWMRSFFFSLCEWPFACPVNCWVLTLSNWGVVRWKVTFAFFYQTLVKILYKIFVFDLILHFLLAMLCKELSNGLRSRSMAGGRVWTLFGSRENSKPEKCL